MHLPTGTLAQRVLAAIEAMPPLKTRKNPYAAFAAGLFGAIGNGLYLRTGRDFGVSLAINVGFSMAMPGAGTLASLLVSAGYGFHRVRTSNARLDALAEAARLAAEEQEQLKALPPPPSAPVAVLAPEEVKPRKAVKRSPAAPRRRAASAPLH